MSGEPHEPPAEVPEDPLIPGGEPEHLTSTAALIELLESARHLGAFAYDTEFIGELSYFPKLCLVQLATAERLAVIDPFDDVDLTALWEAIADPAVETIVHAGMQDLEPVVRLLEKAPARVFDTQIVAAFAGLPYPLGLRKLVHALTGVRLGKGMTFTQWDHRPLSARHLRYAADDVRYLLAARTRLGERLAELGHERWAEAECASITDPALYRFDPDGQFLKVKGADGLDGRGLAILRELVVERDALAREHDVPPRSMLKDDLVIRVVKGRADTLEELEATRGLPRPIVQRDGARLLEAVARGLERPPIKRRRAPREEDSGERMRIDALLAATAAWCLGRSIDPSLVLSRGDLCAWHGRLARGADRSEHRLETGWRGELLRPLLGPFLAGETALALRWDGDRLEASLEESGETGPAPGDP